MNDYQKAELDRDATVSRCVRAWCKDCDRKWEGEMDLRKLKLEIRGHAHRTGHRVVIREEKITEYNFN